MENQYVHNPFSGEVVLKTTLHNYSESLEAINLLRASQAEWSQVPLSERVNYVKSALSYFEDNKSAIAEDISQSMGRPLGQATGEVNGLLERANYMCDIATEVLSPDVIEDSSDFFRAIEHVPLGVIFTIAPWNYPLLTAINSLVPALISGNVVLLKHSSLTLKIGDHFQNAFGQLGGVKCALFHLRVDHGLTSKIIEDGLVDHVIFTGSVNGGRQIAKSAATSLVSTQMELGGKDGAIVLEDSDLKRAAETIVDGACFNSGQSCCGIERVYVMDAVYDEFIELCKEQMSSYKMGNPTDKETNLGPMAQAKSVDMMLSQIKSAVDGGAKVVVGGKDLKIEKARFMEPTLIVDVDQASDLIQEENFGPLLPIVKVGSPMEAIQKMNDSKYGLTASLFTENREKAKVLADQLNVGTVFMNRCDYLDPALPWTGVKLSGYGSGLSKYGFYGVTRRKSIHFKK